MDRFLIVSRRTEKPVCVYVSCQCIQASPWRKPHYRPVYPIGTRGSSILLFRHSHHLLLTIGTAPTPTHTSQNACCQASYMPHLPLLGIEGFVGILSWLWSAWDSLTHHKCVLRGMWTVPTDAQTRTIFALSAGTCLKLNKQWEAGQGPRNVTRTIQWL